MEYCETIERPCVRVHVHGLRCILCLDKERARVTEEIEKMNEAANKRYWDRR